jgi:hypothetical protein
MRVIPWSDNVTAAINYVTLDDGHIYLQQSALSHNLHHTHHTMSTETPASSVRSADREGVHPSSYGTGTIPDTSRSENNPQNRSTDDQPDAGNTSDLGEEYPEQKHAGKIGYGPLYNQGVVRLLWE